MLVQSECGVRNIVANRRIPVSRIRDSAGLIFVVYPIFFLNLRVPAMVARSGESRYLWGRGRKGGGMEERGMRVGKRRGEKGLGLQWLFVPHKKKENCQHFKG